MAALEQLSLPSVDMGDFESILVLPEVRSRGDGGGTHAAYLCWLAASAVMGWFCPVVLNLGRIGACCAPALQELAELEGARTPIEPPIRVELGIKVTRRLQHVDAEVPFVPANDVLGTELPRHLPFVRRCASYLPTGDADDKYDWQGN